MKQTKIIPIFYTCDDSNAKNTITSLRSIIDNADKSYSYSVCILHNGINKQNTKKMFELGGGAFNITLEDISTYIKSSGSEKISYSSDFLTSFILRMFPGYKKSILVSSDYVAGGDICAYFESAKESTSLFRIGC